MILGSLHDSDIAHWDHDPSQRERGVHVASTFVIARPFERKRRERRAPKHQCLESIRKRARETPARIRAETKWGASVLCALILAGLVTACAANRPGQSSPASAIGDPAVQRHRVAESREPHLSHKQLIGLVRRHIKYVFVIYQENRSFDSYFGTFPGADGIYSRPADQTPGFYQAILETNGAVSRIRPFRIGPREFAADTDDVDHSHPSLAAKMDVVNGRARMDRFALAEELKHSKGASRR